MTFHNDTTSGSFDTGSGPNGYTASPYFAIWLPPGSYSVTSIFAYNGAVGPVDEPFSFVVKPGVMIYIGTIVNTWDMPKDGVEQMGRPLAAKRHGRIRCPLLRLSCDAKSEGLAANTYVKGPPYAYVAVHDEGASFAEAIRAAMPELPNVTMQRWLMW